jgi:hypothetical protein
VYTLPKAFWKIVKKNIFRFFRHQMSECLNKNQWSFVLCGSNVAKNIKGFLIKNFHLILAGRFTSSR